MCKAIQSHYFPFKVTYVLGLFFDLSILDHEQFVDSLKPSQGTVLFITFLLSSSIFKRYYRPHFQISRNTRIRHTTISSNGFIIDASSKSYTLRTWLGVATRVCWLLLGPLTYKIPSHVLSGQ